MSKIFMFLVRYDQISLTLPFCFPRLRSERLTINNMTAKRGRVVGGSQLHPAPPEEGGSGMIMNQLVNQ